MGVKIVSTCFAKDGSMTSDTTSIRSCAYWSLKTIYVLTSNLSSEHQSTLILNPWKTTLNVCQCGALQNRLSVDYNSFILMASCMEIWNRETVSGAFSLHLINHIFSPFVASNCHLENHRFWVLSVGSSKRTYSSQYVRRTECYRPRG